MSHSIILTKDTFEHEVLHAEMPVLVDFWAEWCGPCRLMAPILDQLAEKFAGKIKIAKLDVNDPNHQALAEKYEIQGIPAMKIFKDGKIIKELIGYRPAEALEQELAEFAK